MMDNIGEPSCDIHGECEQDGQEQAAGLGKDHGNGDHQPYLKHGGEAGLKKGEPVEVAKQHAESAQQQAHEQNL